MKTNITFISNIFYFHFFFLTLDIKISIMIVIYLYKYFNRYKNDDKNDGNWTKNNSSTTQKKTDPGTISKKNRDTSKNITTLGIRDCPTAFNNVAQACQNTEIENKGVVERMENGGAWG